MPAGFPPRNQFDSSNPSGSPQGGSQLDGPPPHMAPRPAGADTNALMGQSQEGDGNALGMSPKARIIAAIAMLLQSVNLIEGTVPGAVSPQMLMEIDNLRVTLPQAVDQLSQQVSPLGLLSAIGSALAPGMGAGGGTAPMPSLGQSAGMPAGAGSQQPPM